MFDFAVAFAVAVLDLEVGIYLEFGSI